MTNWQKYSSWDEAMAAFIAERHQGFSPECVFNGYMREFREWLDSTAVVQFLQETKHEH